MASQPLPATRLPHIDVRVSSLQRHWSKGSSKFARGDGREDLPAHHDRNAAADTNFFRSPLELFSGDFAVAHVRKKLLAREDAAPRRVYPQIRVRKPFQASDIGCRNHGSLLLISRADRRVASIWRRHRRAPHHEKSRYPVQVRHHCTVPRTNVLRLPLAYGSPCFTQRVSSRSLKSCQDADVQEMPMSASIQQRPDSIVIE